MKSFKELAVKPVSPPGLKGEKIKMSKILNREIAVEGFRIEKSKFSNGRCLHLQVQVDGQQRVVFCSGTVLAQVLEQIPQGDFPFKTKIVKEHDYYEFT